MELLTQIHNVTSQLEEVVNQEITKQNREEAIDKINQLLDQREELLNHLSPPYSEEEKQFLQKILKMDESIIPLLEEIFILLKDDIRNLQRSKQSNQKYKNPYNQVSVSDGMFLDKKK